MWRNDTLGVEVDNLIKDRKKLKILILLNNPIGFTIKKKKEQQQRTTMKHDTIKILTIRFKYLQIVGFLDIDLKMLSSSTLQWFK